jgi:hypothetical protein
MELTLSGDNVKEKFRIFGASFISIIEKVKNVFYIKLRSKPLKYTIRDIVELSNNF